MFNMLDKHNSITVLVIVAALLVITIILKGGYIAKYVIEIKKRHKAKMYGIYVVNYDYVNQLIKKLKRHKHMPYNIKPILKEYQDNLKPYIINLNKITSIYKNLPRHTDEVQTSESYEYIKGTYQANVMKLEKDIASLEELYALCERYTLDNIMLKKPDTVSSERIVSLVGSLNELNDNYGPKYNGDNLQ